MNIPKDDLFFDLLRSGLWDKAGTVADYSSVDWKALIRLAREQTVVGLISDGVSAQKRYGAQLSMPFEDARQLMVQTIGVERAMPGWTLSWPSWRAYSKTTGSATAL